MAKRKRKDALAWGLILVLIGFVLLLQNVDFNIWDFVARLWPVIIIAWGAWKLYFGLVEKNEEAPVPKAFEEKKAKK